MQPTNDNLWELFSALSFIRRQSRDLSKVESALDGVRVSLLSLAAQRGAIHPSEVADELQIKRSLVSRHLQALEQAGGIRMFADPDDGRSWLVEVTPEGYAMLQRFRDSIVEIYGRLLADWDPADVDRLGVLLTRFGESMALDRSRPQLSARARRGGSAGRKGEP